LQSKIKYTSSYERISPTAWMTAHHRTYTDIPYAHDIFDIVEELRLAQGETVMADEFKNPEIAPQIEASHKLVNKLLLDSGISQVFEIAAGLSPRGLQVTSDPIFTYIEIDLHKIAAQKRNIVARITSKQPGGLNQNLRIETGNALNLASLKKATTTLDHSKPIAIINEGLLRYLAMEEKVIVAGNVRELLKQFGGLWITPDISLKTLVHAENILTKGGMDRMHAATGVNIEHNCFDSIGHAKDFFEKLGFSIEIHSLMEVCDELVSPNRLGQSREQVKNLIDKGAVFVMRLAA